MWGKSQILWNQVLRTTEYLLLIVEIFLLAELLSQWMIIVLHSKFMNVFINRWNCKHKILICLEERKKNCSNRLTFSKNFKKLDIFWKIPCDIQSINNKMCRVSARKIEWRLKDTNIWIFFLIWLFIVWSRRNKQVFHWWKLAENSTELFTYFKINFCDIYVYLIIKFWYSLYFVVNIFRMFWLRNQKTV